MRLNIAGSQVDGTYFYDQFKQDLKLEGTFDSKGELSLTEGAGKKKTGKRTRRTGADPAKTDHRSNDTGAGKRKEPAGQRTA